MINTCSAGDQMWRTSHAALDLVSPAAAQVAAAGEDLGPPEQLEVDEVAKRRWKAEQANKALWAFGGRVRQVQQGWKRQQDEAKRAPKQHKTAHNTTTHSSPLLLLNQLYWEQHLGSSIHSITEDNMFGINMFGSYRSICQNMLNSNSNNPAAADSHLQNSSSSCNRDSPVRSGNNQAVRNTPLTQGVHDRSFCLQQDSQLFQQLLKQQQEQQRLQRKQQEQQQQVPQQQQAVDKELQDDANSAVSADSSSSGSSSGSGSDHSSATPAHATPMMGLHDLHEIEAVCRQQQLMHLPANRRFVKAVRFLQAAKQQQQQLQQQ